MQEGKSPKSKNNINTRFGNEGTSNCSDDHKDAMTKLLQK